MEKLIQHMLKIQNIMHVNFPGSYRNQAKKLKRQNQFLGFWMYASYKEMVWKVECITFGYLILDTLIDFSMNRAFLHCQYIMD